jgi:hypothetical protein
VDPRFADGTQRRSVVSLHWRVSQAQSVPGACLYVALMLRRRVRVKNGGYLGLCPCLPTGQLDTDERTKDDAGAIRNLVVCHGGTAVYRAGTYPASLAHVG